MRKDTILFLRNVVTFMPYKNLFLLYEIQTSFEFLRTSLIMFVSADVIYR